jgi:hypothetical protein
MLFLPSQHWNLISRADFTVQVCTRSHSSSLFDTDAIPTDVNNGYLFSGGSIFALQGFKRSKTKIEEGASPHLFQLTVVHSAGSHHTSRYHVPAHIQYSKAPVPQHGLCRPLFTLLPSPGCEERFPSVNLVCTYNTCTYMTAVGDRLRWWPTFPVECCLYLLYLCQ